MQRRLLLLTLVLISLAALSACAGGYAGYYSSVPGAPPPAPVYGYGAIGVAPGPGYVWVNGYYDWRGGNWFWVRGAWMRPPHPRAVWVAPGYRHNRYYAGHWR